MLLVPIFKPDRWSKFFILDFEAWIDWNLSSDDIENLPWPWPLYFGVIVSNLWHDRNKLIFSNCSQLYYQLKDVVINHMHVIDHSLRHPLYSSGLLGIGGGTPSLNLLLVHSS